MSLAAVSAGDFVNKRARNPEQRADLRQGISTLAHQGEDRDIGIRQLGAWVPLAFRNATTAGILTASVLVLGNPLKVLQSVIAANAIKVIDRRAFKPSWDKSPRCENVDKAFNTLPLVFELNSPIPAVVFVWAHDASSSALRWLKRSLGFHNLLKFSNTAQVRNLKRAFPTNRRNPNFIHWTIMGVQQRNVYAFV